MSDAPTPIVREKLKKTDDADLFDIGDKSIQVALATQRLRDARVRHYNLTLDHNIRLANREGIDQVDGLTKSVLERFVEQLDTQVVEALANLQTVKTEVRVLAAELQKLGGE